MESSETHSQFKPEIPPKTNKDRALARYCRLKVKEYFGQLNQKEFDKLLVLDFQEHLLLNPPIKGVFSPEQELARIRNLPKIEKRKALANFKDKLVKQKEAWANCRIFIERSIEFDNNVPKDKLMRIIEQFGERYSFTDKQKKTTEELIDGYYANRKKALEARKLYPDNLILVNILTGLNFDNNTNFEVSVGPMFVEISADDPEAEEIYNRLGATIPLSPHTGFSAKSVQEDPIMIIVLRKDSLSKPNPFENPKSVVAHEIEHLKNRLFREIFDQHITPAEKNHILKLYESEKDPQIKEKILETFFRLEMREALQRAKDEIIAMKKDRRPHSYAIFSEQEDSTYDYLAPIKNWELKKDNEMWQKTSKKILIDEYKRIIESAVEAFNSLTDSGRYSREEAIALFADKSLTDWPKTAKRLLGERTSQSVG